MGEGKITLLAVLVAVFSTAASVSSCATGHHRTQKTADKRDLDAKNKKPKNYSIVKPGQIDYSLLKKGQRDMYSSALDDY